MILSSGIFLWKYDNDDNDDNDNNDDNNDDNEDNNANNDNNDDNDGDNDNNSDNDNDNDDGNDENDNDYDDIRNDANGFFKCQVVFGNVSIKSRSLRGIVFSSDSDSVPKYNTWQLWVYLVPIKPFIYWTSRYICHKCTRDNVHIKQLTIQ